MKKFSKLMVAIATTPPLMLASVLALGESAHAVSITNSTSTPIANNSASNITFLVSGEQTITTAVTISVNITNNTPQQLDIYLSSPGGTPRILQLSTDNGTGGSYNLTFSDGGLTTIASGSNVTSGTFRPEGGTGASGAPVNLTGNISTFAGFNGFNPNGTWTLRIGDDGGAPATTFNSATLNVTAVPFQFSPLLGIAGLGAAYAAKEKAQKAK